jgi:hypothetical protein
MKRALIIHILVLVCLLFSSGAALAVGFQNLTIDNFMLIGTARVDRTHFNYTYQADITNNTLGVAQNITAMLTSNTPATVVVDGTLSFGNVPAGATVTSLDTFVIQQTREFQFDPAQLIWTITSSATPAPGSWQLLIREVYVDMLNQNIIISGENFGSPQAPVVTLGGDPLVVVSHNDTEIVVALPPQFTAGDYLLTLRTGPADMNYAAYDLTVGASGPQGLQGFKGDTGDTGPQGQKGDTGNLGLKGDKGDTGDTGPQGPAGTDGAQGPQGDTGPTGQAGLKGDTGDTGETGPTGPKGDTGDQGLKGDTGPTGPQGVKGNKGSQGTPGAKGDTGGSGLRGPQGETGARGPTGPKGAKGIDGDERKVFYQDREYSFTPLSFLNTATITCKCDDYDYLISCGNQRKGNAAKFFLYTWVAPKLTRNHHYSTSISDYEPNSGSCTGSIYNALDIAPFDVEFVVICNCINLEKNANGTMW